MAFIRLAVALLPAAPLEALQEKPGSRQVAMAFVPGNPLLELPGMKPLSIPRLPSIADPLPAPLITDVSNAPNPFDSRKAGVEGQTQIMYTLANDVPVRVTLYDLLGFRVRRWDFLAGQNGGQSGMNHLFWDGTNENGRKDSKGGYLAQIEIETPDTVVTVIRKIGVIH